MSKSELNSLSLDDLEGVSGGVALDSSVKNDMLGALETKVGEMASAMFAQGMTLDQAAAAIVESFHASGHTDINVAAVKAKLTVQYNTMLRHGAGIV